MVRSVFPLIFVLLRFKKNISKVVYEVLFTACLFLPQDIMLKIKNWVVEEKKHVRFCHDWNDKEVFICEGLVCYAFSVV